MRSGGVDKVDKIWEDDPAAEANRHLPFPGVGLASLLNLVQNKGMMSEGNHTQQLPPGMVIGPDGKPCRACRNTSVYAGPF